MDKKRSRYFGSLLDIIMEGALMRSGIHLHTLRGTLHNYDYTRFYQTLCSLGGIRTLIICKTAYGP